MTTEKKRRGQGTGSIYQRRKDLWSGQIDLGLVDGKRKRVTVYGRTRRIVETKLKDLGKQLDEHGDLPTSDSTLEKWLTYWLEHIAARRLKPNTFRQYKTYVTQYLIPSIGKVKVGKLSAAHLRQMHDYIIVEKGKSPTTAHNAHRILSVALNDGVRDGRIPRNAASKDAPTKAESARESMDPADAIKLLRAAAEDRLGSRWLVALLTGMRQGERLGLRWAFLDLEEGAADLSWAQQRVPYRHGCNEPCGKKRAASCPERKLSIPAHMTFVPLDGNLVLMRPKTKGSLRRVALIEPLRQALVRRHDTYLMERDGYAVDHDLVFCEPDGSAIDPRKDYREWCDLLERAGLKHVTGHETRHTTATLLLEAGTPIRVVEEILGHTQAATTQLYQHVSLALQREALQAVGQRLELT